MPAMSKRVNINAPVAVRNVTPPIYGTIKDTIMTTGDILKCICKRAAVDEILPNGNLVKLTMKNYCTDNGAGLYASKDADKPAKPKNPGKPKASKPSKPAEEKIDPPADELLKAPEEVINEVEAPEQTADADVVPAEEVEAPTISDEADAAVTAIASDVVDEDVAIGDPVQPEADTAATVATNPKPANNSHRNNRKRR